MENTIKKSPLLRQYEAIKEKYPNYLLLFRIGDFYECFNEDAQAAAEILGVSLYDRPERALSKMAGFSNNMFYDFLPKLMKAGNRVAVCDQVEDPSLIL
jgi:DNA mismatch repair protein mutS